jgi:hypothetical protein
MIRLSSRHLCRPAFRGPAERIVVELWLTGLSGLMLNGYREVRCDGGRARLQELASVEVLAYRRRRNPARTERQAA